jgi:serine/threonine-protein kinase
MSDEPASPAPSGTVSCPHCGDAHPIAWSHCPNTGRSLGTGKALVGRMIAERYRVVGLLAEGGMGTVYAAEHALIGRRVAIKRLHPELARDAATVERFQREARAAAALGHENIVEVIDMGFAEDGAPYLAMEYLKGETLATALKREGRLAPARACYVLGQVLSALEVVHDRGIVHRDLKPDNIFLTRRGGRSDFVKVLDFGVSKMRAEDGSEPSSLTRTGVMVGTPHYISPEQARGSRSHDHRVDLYAVGVMLYECLTGRLPFDGHNYHALLQAILAGAPRPLRELVPQVPSGLVAVVEKAMARSPAERYHAAVEMRDALLPFGAVAVEATDEWAVPEARRSRDGRIPTTRPAAPTLAATPTPPPSAPRRAAASPSRAPAPPPARRRPTSRPPAPPATRALDAAPPPRDPPSAGPRSIGALALAEVSVPLPHGFLPTPKVFEAQSDDWQDPPDEAPRPAKVATPARGAPSAWTPAPLGTPPPEPRLRDPADPPRIKGAFVAAALDHLREAHGPGGLERVLAKVPPESAFQLRGVLMPVAWMPASLLSELALAAELVFGRGEARAPSDVARALGEAVATRALSTTHRHFIQGVTPTMAVQRIPKIWRTYHNGGEVTVRRAPSGWLVEVSGHAPLSATHAEVMMGFYAGLLEITGAREVRAELVVAGPEAARTVTELRWR